MRHYSLEGSEGNTERNVMEMEGSGSHPVVLASSAFVLGLATGLLLKGRTKRIYDRARNALWHREYDRTISYGENLPESLERREQPSQPRFGGTGALGVSPGSVGLRLEDNRS